MSRELCLMDGNTIIIGRDNVIDHFVRPRWRTGNGLYLTSKLVHVLVAEQWRNAKLDNLLFERDIP